jgi:predicted double-glycine peptidase
MKMSKFRIAVLVLLAVAVLAIALISTVSTVYTSEQIPSSYFIKVNYTEQETWFYCGPACVQMGLSYWSIFVNQTELAEEMGTSEESNGTLEGDMNIPFDKRNVEVHTEYLNIDKLKVHISHGEPVIILIFFDLDLTGRHYLVVIGYTEDAIYVHDPWPTSRSQPVGRQSGANVSISNSMLNTLRIWEGGYWALVIPCPPVWWQQHWHVIASALFGVVVIAVIVVFIKRKTKLEREEGEQKPELNTLEACSPPSPN